MKPSPCCRGVRRILVVDDEATGAETLGVALCGVAGAEVSFARGAEEALALLAQGTFALLVTDIHLPRMDGLELLAAVRARPRSSALPVVVINHTLPNEG